MTRVAAGGIAVVAAAAVAPEGWDERAVDAPGGDVHQSTINAAHRAGQGWRPTFLTFEDGRPSLVLLRRARYSPAVLAYAPRGPVPASDEPATVAARAVGLAAWARGAGATALVVDPILAADPTYDARLTAAGFAEVEEVQAERHRMILAFAARATEDSVLRGVSRSTRQRIHAAEASGTSVDEASDAGDLERFAAIYVATASRRRFWIGRPAALVSWWERVLGAGRAVLLLARHDGRIVGGLLLYRQGGRYATAVSGDDAATREDLPGTMHLLRWTAIRRALAAGHGAIDLGGVDLPGARRIPLPGEPTFGLYEHKRSFGAVWTPHAAAHRLVLRPWLDRGGRLMAAGAAIVRRLPTGHST